MIRCPHCGSTEWSFNGKRKLKDGTLIQRYLCKKCHREFTIDSKESIDKQNENIENMSTEDTELIKENVKLSKQKQKFQDLNRIERKAFREYVRIENAVSEYTKELIKVLENHKINCKTIKHEDINNNTVGILHFTDAHFNELVDIKSNKYDFKIAAKRAKLFVEEAKKYFKLKKVKTVLFAMTGDLLNSDRRLDELLSEATNRSKATFLAVEIIEKMLLDLNKDFNVIVSLVTGNESRITDVIGWTDIVATDNYDFTIFNILNYIFKGTKGISFIFGEDPTEQVISILNKNILLIHGNQLPKSNTEKAIQSIKGKYVARGIDISFVLLGHLHSARIGDTYARGSSLVGANAYSDRALQLTSRASQNIHIVYNTDRIDSIKIDLQDVTGVKGYDINRSLQAYNTKSIEKVLKKETIFKIVI